MNQLKKIEEGILFVLNNDLSKREIEVFNHLLTLRDTVEGIAFELGKSETNIHNVLFNLRNKALVEFKDKTSDGRVIYGIIGK